MVQVVMGSYLQCSVVAVASLLGQAVMSPVKRPPRCPLLERRKRLDLGFSFDPREYDPERSISVVFFAFSTVASSHFSLGTKDERESSSALTPGNIQIARNMLHTYLFVPPNVNEHFAKIPCLSVRRYAYAYSDPFKSELHHKMILFLARPRTMAGVAVVFSL